MSKKILIIGGSGSIGSALSRELTNKGHSPLVSTRNAALTNKNSKDAHHVYWDGKDPERLAGLLEDADGVVNLAGASLSSRPWTPGYRRKIVSSRTVPGRALAEAIGICRNKPGFVIQGSASGYYGTDPDRPCTENNPPGEGFLAETVTKWESSVKDIENQGVRLVWIRTGPVIDRDHGMLFLLLIPFILGLSIIPGNGLQWIPWVHIDDVAGAICHLAENENNRGAFNLTAPNPATLEEMIFAVEKRKRKLVRFRIPSQLMNLVLGTMARETIQNSQFVIPEKLLHSGYRFKFSYIEPAIENLLTKTLS